MTFSVLFELYIKERKSNHSIHHEVLLSSSYLLT